MTDSVSPDHLVTSTEALKRLYGEPFGPSLVKESDRITTPYRAFIEAAPFFALASGGPDGFDCSPRGDAPGFVRVHDERTLLVPDRRGNNRMDTLRNILHDPRVALLFLIPGCSETIRVMGVAFEIARAALHLKDLDDPTKLAIAAGKIIELAKAGETNPDLLSEQALASLTTPPPRDAASV